jgi:hypothetical protein
MPSDFPSDTTNAFSADIEFGPENAPAGLALTPIVTMVMPPGRYMFFAKTVILTNATASSDCILTFDTGDAIGEKKFDASHQVASSVNGTAQATHNLQGLLQLTTNATIRLQGRAAIKWSAIDSKISAIQVQNAESAAGSVDFSSSVAQKSKTLSPIKKLAAKRPQRP